MNIKKTNQNQWEIKTKKSKIIFNNEIIVNDFKIPGVGEYEISSVQVEALDQIYIFYADDLVITLIDEKKKEFSADEIKKIGQCDILFIPVAGKNTMDIKKALSIVSATEPYIVIPIHYDDLEQFKKSEGLDVKESEELKINKSDLLEDQREVYILK